ncbi:MAG: hypothetical protein HY966_02785, partial [Ignavibacteriales bacterium]|nr:hypothetical protein [Ignavibacteriales bacterium]
NGRIEKEEGGRIDGYEDYSNASTADYRERRSTLARGGSSFNVPWLSESANIDNFIFRYNRVESVFLGFGTQKRFYWDGRKNWNSYGSVGWGFKSHTWRGNLGLSRQVAFSDESLNQMFELGAEGYSLTDTKDQWIIGVHENTAAAFLIHEDFRDYFERTGATFHVAYYTQGDYLNTEFKVAYVMDKYDSLSNKVEWAMFGGDKVFRQNPPIAPGQMKSVMASVGVTTLTKTSRGPEGWNLFASAEFARKDFGPTNFDFDQYVVDVRRYQPLGRYDNFNVRVRAGTSTGVLPLQKAFEYGGLGTLNGYAFKSDIGNRMLLINAEYIVNGNFLDDLELWPTWLFRSFNFIITSDAGIMRSLPPASAPTSGFEKITWGEFKHNMGFGFSNRSGSFRIGVAWRTDSKEPAQILFRFTRPF